ncbi:MAG: hypothetical protein ABL998_24025 [Planctomycetota bacterium]
MHVRPLALLCSLACASCALPSLDVQPRYASLSIEGQAGFSSGGTGAAADVEDAGLDDDSTVGGRLDFKFGAPHLVLLAQAPRFEGDGTLDVSVSDGTNTISAGANVASKIDLEMYDAALLFDLIPGDTIEVALGFGVAYLDMALRFEEDGTGTTVASDEAAPVPLLAAGASVWIGPVEVTGFAGGVRYELDGDEINYLDLDAYARWKLFGGSHRLRGSLVGGYRLTQMDVEYDDGASNVDVDLTIQGPYVGLQVSL